MWLQFLPRMVGSHALRGQGSDRPHLLNVSSCPPPHPPHPRFFEGDAAREEPPLVEQPRRILGGKIGLFGSGQIGP